MTATLPADVVTQLGITEPGEVILEVVAINDDGTAAVETEGDEEEEELEEEPAPVPAGETAAATLPAAVGAMINKRKSGY